MSLPLLLIAAQIDQELLNPAGSLFVYNETSNQQERIILSKIT